MKKRYLKFILLFIVTGSIIFACWDDNNDLGQEKRVSSLVLTSGKESKEVLAAKQWYEENEQRLFLSRNGKVQENPLFEDLSPAWIVANTAYNRKQNLMTVEVPIASLKRTIFALPENAITYEQTKDARYIRSYTALVICTELGNKKMTGFFMTQLPSKKYLEDTKFGAYGSLYLYREKNFDGQILFHDMNGEFINGWVYSEGKITSKILSGTKTLSRGHIETYVSCVPMYKEVYTDLIYIVEAGGYIGDTISNGQKVEYVFIGNHCFTHERWVPDAGDLTPGGGGEGAVDKPTDPPVIEEEKDPWKIDCSEVGTRASEQTKRLMEILDEIGLDEKFITPYLQDNIEHGVHLLQDKKTGLYSFSNFSSGSSNKVSYDLSWDEDKTPIAMIHNHPLSSQPSPLDAYTLTKQTTKQENKNNNSIVLCKDSTIFAMQIVDAEKANQFYRTYTIKNKLGQDSLDTQKLENTLIPKIRDAFDQIRRTSVTDESSLKEFYHFALAHVLESEQAGIILLRKKKEDDGFKMLSAKKFIYLYGENNRDTLKIIYRQICK